MVDVGWSIMNESDVANDGGIDQICMLDLLFRRQSLDLFVKTSCIVYLVFHITLIILNIRHQLQHVYQKLSIIHILYPILFHHIGYHWILSWLLLSAKL